MKLALVLISSAVFLPLSAGASEKFDIAITVDDLPLQGSLTPGTTRLEIARSYLTTLKQHHVPEAYGFINAAKLKDAPDGDAVYDLWIKSGYVLGNHGYTHMNLNKPADLSEWFADVEQNEPVLKAHMKGKDWHFFRLPNLTGGGKSPRHDQAIAYLKTRGYKLAEVSVSFNDWAYAEAYNRCVVKGDRASIDVLETQYLKQVDDGIIRMEAVSTKVYGRVIPQVLLTHLSGWSAYVLPKVMDRLEKQGAHYVTLSQAESDQAYQEPNDDAGNGVMMDRAAARAGIDLSDAPDMSAPKNVESVCQ